MDLPPSFTDLFAASCCFRRTGITIILVLISLPLLSVPFIVSALLIRISHRHNPFGKYPFILWLAPSNSSRRSTHPAHDRGLIASPEYRLYLYPDELMFWHWTMALVIALPLLWVHWCWTILFLATYCLIFYSLYHWSRRPVLREFIEKMPPRLNDWWIGLVERIDLRQKDAHRIETSSHRADLRLWQILNSDRGKLHSWLGLKKRRFRAPGWRRPLRQYGMNSPEERLARAAIAEFFGWEPGHPGKGKGMQRFAYYWCAPIWIPYLLLWLPLLFMATFPSLSTKTDAIYLVVPISIWLIVSLKFFTSQHQFLHRHKWQLGATMIGDMPLVLHETLTKSSRLPELASSISFNRLIYLIYIATFGMYLLTLNLLVSAIDP